MRSITITSWAQKSQYISGISTSGLLAALRRNWAALPASRIRSSSSCRYLLNSSTTSRGLRRRASAPPTRSIQPAIQRIRLVSFSITGSKSGRNTLTATSRRTPWRSISAAKCTCATEALATGSRSNCTNRLSSGLPKARSMVAIATSAGKGGTRSCSLVSSAAMSGGSRSRRVESTWPNLTKSGPSFSSAMRSRWPRGASRLRPRVIRRPRVRKPDWGAEDRANSSSP